MGLRNWFRRLFVDGSNDMRVHEDLQHLLNCHLDFLRQLHVRGSLAPLAASMDHTGNVTGQAITVKSSSEAAISVAQVLADFAQEFRTAFRAGQIRASAIFFHGSAANGSVSPARTADEANAIVAWLEHATGETVQGVIRYIRKPLQTPGVSRWSYEPPEYTARSEPLG